MTGQVSFRAIKRSEHDAITLVKRRHMPPYPLQISVEDPTLRLVWCEYAAPRLFVLVECGRDIAQDVSGADGIMHR
jgi:hypothetical protein